MTMILIVNGPNLDMLGKRDPNHYGTTTLKELEDRLLERADELDIELDCFQSNIEGELVTFINKSCSNANGIIINPAGLTKVGFSLLDACIDSHLPVVEVHLSNIQKREPWRSDSIFSRVVDATLTGMRWMGYVAALDFLAARIKKEV